MSDVAPSDFLTAEEAAHLVNCNRFSLDRWVKDGHLNVYRTPGGHKRFKRSDLIRMLQSGTPRGRKGADVCREPA